MRNTILSVGLLVTLALVGCKKKPEAEPESAPAPAPQSATVDAAAPPPPPPPGEEPAPPTEGPPPTPAEATVNITYLNQCIADFYTAEMRAPRDLNELVKGGYAKSLPTPPTGKKFVIDQKTRQVLMVNK